MKRLKEMRTKPAAHPTETGHNQYRFNEALETQQRKGTTAMKNSRTGMAQSSSTLMLTLAASFVMNAGAAAQNTQPKDSCDVVHTAYKKTFKVGSQMEVKNSGTVNVTEAQGTITGDGAYNESCKLIGDESLNGEAATIYSEVMKAHAGTADGKVWISKAQGLVLKQDVIVDMSGKGKGEQIITFAYKKK